MSSSTEPIPKKAKSFSWRNLAINLGLSGLSICFVVGLLELVFRFMGYGNLEIYQPDPVVYWRLKSNQNCFTKVDHKPVHINSLGTRGPEFTPAKPAGLFRIISLGDSRTFGWGLNDDETYSRVLEKELRANGRNVEVINAGVNAWSFMQMNAFFREIALKWQPDMVIIGEGNLWTQFRDDASPEFVRKFMRQVRLKNFLRHFALYHYFIEVQLQDVYQKYRTKFIPVDPKQDVLFKDQQKSDPDAIFREAISKLTRLAMQNKITPILLYMPRLDCFEPTNRVGGYKAKVQITAETKAPFVDITDEIAPRGKSLYLDADPVHFNVEGNQIIARRLREVISKPLNLK